MKTKILRLMILCAMSVMVFSVSGVAQTEWGQLVIGRPSIDQANAITFIDTGTPSTVSGKLTQWSFWAYDNGSDLGGNFKLQVFRHVGNNYQLTGQTVVTSWSKELNSIDISAAPIDVAQGDYIGFRYNFPLDWKNRVIVGSWGAENPAPYQWTEWLNNPINYDVAIGGTIPISAFNFGGGINGEHRVYSLAATVQAVPEPPAIVAACVMLLPFGLSKLRSLRK